MCLLFSPMWIKYFTPSFTKRHLSFHYTDYEMLFSCVTTLKCKRFAFQFIFSGTTRGARKKLNIYPTERLIILGYQRMEMTALTRGRGGRKGDTSTAETTAPHMGWWDCWVDGWVGGCGSQCIRDWTAISRTRERREKEVNGRWEMQDWTGEKHENWQEHKKRTK